MLSDEVQVGAVLGAVLIQDLHDQRLSDDAAHVSATSLHRQVHRQPDGSGWDDR